MCPERRARPRNQGFSAFAAAHRRSRSCGRGAAGGFAQAGELEFDMAIAPRKPVIGPAQRRFRVDFEVAREVHDREQQVAEFRFTRPGSDEPTARSSSASSSSIFARGPAASGQSKPAGGGAGTELSRARQGRQGDRHVGQRAGLAARRALLALHAFPGARLLLGVGHDGIAEDVRMAPRQLVADRVHDVVESECALLARESRVEGDLEQEIAQLVTERSEVTALDRVRDFVGFLDRVRRDGPKSCSRSQGQPRSGSRSRVHDLEQPFQSPWMCASPRTSRSVSSMPAVAPQMLKLPQGRSKVSISSPAIRRVRRACMAGSSR